MSATQPHSGSKLNWGIIGAGNIAKAFSKGLAGSKTGKLIAIGSRSREKAVAFGKNFGVDEEKCYGSYDALLADPDVQAVYVATPHPQHAEWAIKAASAKKHLLVEKPIGINAAEAMAMIDAARHNGAFLMEAYMYRCHPQIARIVELIRSGAIGQVRLIQATFSFQAGFKEDGRLFANDSAGGGILDVGGYPVSFARLVAGAARGKPFADPESVSGAAHLGQTGVDEWAAAVLKFTGDRGKGEADIIAEVATGVALNQDSVVRIYGSEGWILVATPWIPAREGGDVKLTLHKNGQPPPQEIIVHTDELLYGLEADAVGNAVAAGSQSAPEMSWDDTMGQARTLDRWRQSAGLTYEMEKVENYPRTTLEGKTLAKSPEATMKYGKVAGVAKPISRLVMGCDNQSSLPHAAVMFDDYFERGGNAFDTSFVYGGGTPEKMLGQWMQLRGVREQCVTIAKGLHSPECWPHRVAHELPITLERLRTNYTDLYLMHRDNPKVPVGEFVEAINEQIAAKKILAWGGSNWTVERFDEAKAYANAKGLVAPVAISNNFSLARMVNPPWAGCLTAGDPQTRAWLEKTQTALFAWSSQARGFFLPGRAAPEKREDEELVRCWYADDNFARLARANELAKKKNVQPINIALAWALHQPFPTFALIGPRELSETRSSLAALDFELTDQEVTWLDQG